MSAGGKRVFWTLGFSIAQQGLTEITELVLYSTRVDKVLAQIMQGARIYRRTVAARTHSRIDGQGMWSKQLLAGTNTHSQEDKY